MIFVFFFGFVFVLLVVGSVLGFLTALYVVRPRLFNELLRLLGGVSPLAAKIFVGLTISVCAPIVGGLSYAVSGSRWFVDLFGDAGQWFWGWVGVAFLLGLILGCILRHSPMEQLPPASGSKTDR